MKRSILISGLLVLVISMVYSQTSFYDFTVKDINGEDYPLSQLKGKKVLVVNTASKCGNTPQYEGLQELYEKYKDDGFVILDFQQIILLSRNPGQMKILPLSAK